MKSVSIQLSILILVACVIESHQEHRSVTRLFIFGDSIFDPGNNNYISSPYAIRANFKPYGVSYFEQPTGRFSDGRLIPDFIAEFANLPMIPSYCQALLNGTSIYGVNFASGGAGCLDQTYTGKVISLNSQLSRFKLITERLKAELGEKDSEAFYRNAVYLFSIGHNDYARLFNIPDTTPDVSCLAYTTEQEYLDAVMNNFVFVIKEIYKLGGRKFGIQSLLPFGCVPRFRGIAFLKVGLSDLCLDGLNSIIKKHNLALTQKLKEFNKELRGFEYSYFSIYDALNQLLDNPSLYGFKEAKTACCGLGPYRGFGVCGIFSYELCDEVKEHVMFDNFHPSERAYLHLAQIWWQGAPDMVEPKTLKSLFQRHIRAEPRFLSFGV